MNPKYFILKYSYIQRPNVRSLKANHLENNEKSLFVVIASKLYRSNSQRLSNGDCGGVKRSIKNEAIPF